MYDLHLSNTLRYTTGVLKSKEAVWCDGASLGYNSKTVSKKTKEQENSENLQQLTDAQTRAGEARSTGPTALANAHCVINNSLYNKQWLKQNIHDLLSDKQNEPGK